MIDTNISDIENTSCVRNVMKVTPVSEIEREPWGAACILRRFNDGVFICTCNVKSDEYDCWKNHAFSLMQRFEITVINKCMIFPAVILCRLDITFIYENAIIDSSQNTGCTPGYSFYSRYCSHFHNISHTWGNFYLGYIWILHSSRRALSVQFLLVNIFFNYLGIIDDNIL